ncbi:cytochrome ubiquinol oxidase subunit I [Conexibacter sp. CPCC 206217]|uniref:cytochrome ubiquinol oxidase subunit I n=1 Tax=Conexibacter sp. CPCC 206217 TaxID=3064574 RepID=UPI00272116EA|nr:cytochrome ubiquinol oxidase subunit I [Conexibacter sp. CPCC 206217]MDO8213584.1 cytochrome ubiquinol oxidase subunit I [Conexibacter sp. CPCC 206217]
MNTLELARLQFGVTTLFHFIFVPLSIGLAAWVALCQTRYHRTGDETYLRMTRFWGKLMLISLAIGVVTGIVQEFQFGMNWSRYSRYVGDVFGAPLAMEGLAAFFLESTFLGLWIFGWGKLSPRVHLACVWALAFGSALSAYFILAANSWMQHPVGYELNEVTGRAEMTSIWHVLTNNTALYALTHTLLGAATTAGAVVLGVCAWRMLRRDADPVWSRSARLALPIVLVAAFGTAVSGHFQGMLMEDQQPMKMAAAEAQFETKQPASFSLFATGDFSHNPGRTTFDLRIPHALSILATGTWNGKVEGIDEIQRQEQAKYGPGDYTPIVAVTYWSFRLMVGAGSLLILLALLGVWLMRRAGRLEGSRWYLRAALAGAALPTLANLSGWVFTEMGRQPWVVYGLLRTSDANSPRVGAFSLIVTIVGFTLLYGVLAAIGGWLFCKEVRHGAPPPRPDGEAGPDGPDGSADDDGTARRTDSDDLALAY